MNEEINKICEILSNKMKEKFPDSGYTIFITLWQDDTFKVECRSGIPLDVEGYHLLRIFYWYNGEIKYAEDTYPPQINLDAL